MIGGIVNVDAGNLFADVDAIGVWLESPVGRTAQADLRETAFNLTAGLAGSVLRIVGNGSARSPYLWEAGSQPPSVASQMGSDLFVETDCDATACAGGAEPHLMIYDASCSPTPWYDVVRRACRN
jgi:hypothetical protein